MHFKRFILSGLLFLLAGIMAACGSSPAATSATSVPATPVTVAPTADGMGHTAMPGMGDATGASYDATFIDSMILHHDGAISMANQALTSAEHPEIKQLAQAIVSAQQSEIGKMRDWRTAWYPNLATTQGMGMDMGAMMIADGATPFDQRFIEAMIPHHQSAIVMARDALQKAERQEIKDLAQAIITAQEAEIAQMRQWLKQWYGIDR
ncbi:MAG: DUF305 domain-containing protein [Roseiflexaceae bacterium]|nr:DUF305 domain-containing protein [Roseiflexaceae bacterium]